MREWEASFTFHSWWQMGSGTGRGGEIDEMVSRSPDGLPWIPGKTVKGLIREALNELEDFGWADEGISEKICGSAPEGKMQNNAEANRKRYQTNKGKIRFGSAEMSKEWRDWARDKKEPSIIEALFDKRQMSAIEKQGIAKEHSLRSIEVTAPMVLKAKLQALIDDSLVDEYGNALEECAPLIRHIGRSRNRGFGRVSVEIKLSSGGEK